MGKFVSSCVSGAPLLVLQCLGQSERSWEWDQGVQVYGVAPRALLGWVLPWDAAVTPPITSPGARGAGREGEDPSSRPARMLVAVHT